MTWKQGNLVICTSKKRPETLIEQIKETAWKNGFGTIKLIEFENEEKFQVRNLTFRGTKNTKTCRLIFRALTHAEMDLILDATEDESLTTGDNSPLRAMAHRKTIVYDTRVQKLGYAQAIIDLAAQHDPRFKKLLSMAFWGQLKPELDESDR